MLARVFLALALLLPLGLSANESADQVDQLVELFNPVSTDVTITSGFTTPASDVAEQVQKDFIFSVLVFLPFLILPQIALLVVIFKFRQKKGDSRKPARFTHHNKLEIIWTLIPVVALIIATVPVTKTLWWTDLPPDELLSEDTDALIVDVIGKQFFWRYHYPDYKKSPDDDSGLTLSLGPLGQLPIVLEKDRLTYLQFASDDVNHAWAVPSFGIKKDCYRDRWNYSHFTPTVAGQFEGQCYELCGNDHGKMLVSAVVVDSEKFDMWIDLQHNRSEAQAVVEALAMDAGAERDQAIVTNLSEYRQAGDNDDRQLALHYWTAFEFWSQAEVFRAQGENDQADSLMEQGKALRAELSAKLALTPSFTSVSPELAQR